MLAAVLCACPSPEQPAARAGATAEEPPTPSPASVDSTGSGVEFVGLDVPPWRDAIARARSAKAPTGALVFLSPGDHGKELWAVDAAGGDPAQILAASPALRGHVWSPDGRRVALGIRGGREVLVLEIEAGSFERHQFRGREIVPVGWTPDGGHLLVETRSAEGEVGVERIAWDAEPSARALEPVAKPARAPQWSPDGQRWLADLGDHWEVRSVGEGGGNRLAPARDLAQVRWHPTGEFLSFWRKVESSAKTQWRLTLGGTGGTRMADLEVVVDEPASRAKMIRDYAISPDGSFVAYAWPSESWGTDLWVANLADVSRARSVANTQISRPQLAWISSAAHARVKALGERPPLELPAPGALPHSH